MPTSLSFGRRLQLAGKAAVGLLTNRLSPEATAMLAGIMPGGRGEPPLRDTRAYLEAYTNMPWLRAVAGRVAASYAAVPWWLKAAKSKRTGKHFRVPEAQRGDETSRAKALKELDKLGELVDVEVHPMLDLIYGGNALLTGMQNRKLQSIYVDVPGECFWMKERNALGAPVAAWPLPPHWVAALPTPGHRFFRLSFMGWQREIPDTEILMFTDANPVNPYGRGMGVARSLADELDTDEAAAKMSRAYFFNRGRPDIVVSGEGMDETQVKRLESKWREKSRRYLQFAVPFFLNGKIDAKEIGKSLKEMEFVDLREFERNTVQQVWGLPPEYLGVIENSNRSTIDAAELIYGRQVLVPRLEATREVFQQRLVPEYDDRLIVGYESPVREDTAFRLDAAKAAPWAQTVDEWRALQGQPPKEDGSGDVHLVPAQLIAVQRLDELEREPAPDPADPAAVPVDAGAGAGA